MAELIQYANGVPGIKWPVDKIALQIGRAVEVNDIWLDDAFVSKKHAQIVVKRAPGDEKGLEYFLQDLRSTNHTYVNNEQVAECQLSHNDIIMIGKNKLVFLIEGIQDYVSVADFQEDNTETLSSDFSVAQPKGDIPKEEISVEEIQQKELDDLAAMSSSNLSARHRFSRRLNIY